jgi:hypothetical protein
MKRFYHPRTGIHMGKAYFDHINDRGEQIYRALQKNNEFFLFRGHYDGGILYWDGWVDD